MYHLIKRILRWTVPVVATSQKKKKERTQAEVPSTSFRHIWVRKNSFSSRGVSVFFFSSNLLPPRKILLPIPIAHRGVIMATVTVVVVAWKSARKMTVAKSARRKKLLVCVEVSVCVCERDRMVTCVFCQLWLFLEGRKDGSVARNGDWVNGFLLNRFCYNRTWVWLNQVLCL